MTLKQLLLSRKNGFIKYILGSFIPIFNNLAFSLIFALLIGLIEDISKLNEVLFYSGLLVIGSNATQILSRLMRIGYMRDILLDVRRLAFKKFISKSHQQFAMESKDTYLSNLVNDINTFEQDFFLSLLNVIVSLGVFIIALAILFYLEPTIALITLAVSVIMLIISSFFEKRTIDIKQRVSTANESFSIAASNTISGLEILKLNQVEDRFYDQFIQKVFHVEKLKQTFNIFNEGQRVTLESIAHLFSLGILFLVSLRIAQGQTLTYAMFMVQLVNSVIWNLVHTLPLFNKMKASESIYNKIAMIDEKQVVKDRDQPFVFNDSITLNNVDFAYPDQPDRLVLKNVNAKIEKGKKYLLKGASGAGKTTFLQLISKVFEPTNGTILLDETNYSQLNTDSFNKEVAFIYQSVFVFNDTIKNNITLFNDEIDPQVLDKAIVDSGLSEFIKNKELGLETMVEENGKNLSGGERQRISIARALVKQAQLLFVDEATSSLDSELGQAIEQTLLNLDQTVIAISHRTYPGISEQYDQVLSINNQYLNTYNTVDYFELGGINQ